MATDLPLDLLRLTPEDHQRLVEEMDEAAEAANAACRRRAHRRHNYQQRSVIALIRHPGGTDARCIVSTRNLSAGGLGFLHGSFLHAGTECILYLRKMCGEVVALRGKVVCCRHIRGKVHEIGLQFHKAIEPSQFIDPGEFVDSAGGEAPDAQKRSDAGAAGPITVIVADDELAGRVEQALVDAPHEVVRVAPSADAAKAVRERQPSVVICDGRSETAAGAPSPQDLRQAGGAAALVAVADDPASPPEGADAALAPDAGVEDIRNIILGLLDVPGDEPKEAAA